MLGFCCLPGRGCSSARTACQRPSRHWFTYSITSSARCCDGTSMPTDCQRYKRISSNRILLCASALTLDASNMCHYGSVNPLETEDASLGFDYASNVWQDRIPDHDLSCAGGSDEPRA